MVCEPGCFQDGRVHQLDPARQQKQDQVMVTVGLWAKKASGAGTEAPSKLWAPGSGLARGVCVVRVRGEPTPLQGSCWPLETEITRTFPLLTLLWGCRVGAGTGEHGLESKNGDHYEAAGRENFSRLPFCLAFLLLALAAASSREAAAVGTRAAVARQATAAAELPAWLWPT